MPTKIRPTAPCGTSLPFSSRILTVTPLTTGPTVLGLNCRSLGPAMVANATSVEPYML
ncbi:Uncharacterised protein [Mycobacterium tuberculosis]|uniref:Uncharacterized protein n=1 Tax=Mycobacterium tuberculosis TaxID=1773 RepID=A0A0U0V315_MYCTX|nr:Uncharacterised protein [Mycobacterium tuberculosis]COZ01011.1 Uncharacterised protein [Mycobacterium tuberculosis]CPC15272.1 Uncharacterised protein [Mycobacterium tuberculosis]